jgi:hypothetical protein
MPTIIIAAGMLRTAVAAATRCGRKSNQKNGAGPLIGTRRFLSYFGTRGRRKRLANALCLSGLLEKHFYSFTSPHEHSTEYAAALTPLNLCDNSMHFNGLTSQLRL